MSRRSSILRTLAVLATVGAAASGFGQTSETPVADKKLEDTPTLTVRGTAELLRPADEIRLRIGVVTEAPEAGDALRENSTRMRAVVAALRKTGLDEKEYQTGRFQIRPVYTRRPRQPDADWTPKITAYSVTNSVTVRTQKLDLAGDVIEAGNRAGANSVEVEGFGLSDPRAYREDAIKEATTNAITDARQLAAAADLRLVRIVSITLDGASVRNEMMMSRGRTMAMADSGSPPIEAGDVTVQANVSIVYEIASGG